MGAWQQFREGQGVPSSPDIHRYSAKDVNHAGILAIRDILRQAEERGMRDFKVGTHLGQIKNLLSYKDVKSIPGIGLVCHDVRNVMEKLRVTLEVIPKNNLSFICSPAKRYLS